jgi:hypothetical protein
MITFGKRLPAAPAPTIERYVPAATRQVRQGPPIPPIVVSADLTGVRQGDVTLKSAPLAHVVRAYADPQ